MVHIMDLLKVWSPILVPLLGLLAGTGWLQYYLKSRSEKQGKYQAYLEGFLIPLEGILKITSSNFLKLQDDRELTSLEYHPGRLQHFFTSLADDDPRKLLWKSRIEWMQKENKNAVDLIDRYYGKIRLREFMDACDEFKLHAKEWELMWSVLYGSGAVPDSLNVSGALLAPKFPDGLEKALRTEIAITRKLAGRM
jgi:hypothetical protein